MFYIFEKNSKIQNGRHFWYMKYSLKLERLAFTDTPWVKNFAEIALSGTVFELQAFLCFVIFARKFKMATTFWQVKYSLKLGKAGLHRYPVGQKFCRNRSISQFFRYKHFCVLHFYKKFESSKWPPFLVGQKF